MNDLIQKLLQEADEHRLPRQMPDSADLAERVLKARRRRTIVRSGSLVAVIAMAAMMSLIAIERRHRPFHQLAMNHKPALQGRVESANSTDDPGLKARLVAEINQLQMQVVANDRAIRELEAIQRTQRAEAEIAWMQMRSLPEQQIAERAASIVVYQTDRMYRATGQSASAIQAYREVLENFPGTASAEVAKQRLIDVEKAS